MKKFLIALFAVMVLAGTSTGIALAQSETEVENEPETVQRENRGEEIRTQREFERQERQVTRVLERCERITDRLTAHIGRVNTGVERQVGIYERMLARFDAVIDRAAELGYDTTDLTASREAVAEQLATFQATATETTTQLSAAADEACTEDPQAYGVAISSARSELATVREAAQAIRTTFREQAIPALQDFRAWLEVNQPEAAEEE